MKWTDVVLLGAGASIEAGVPGAYDMTDAVIEWIHDEHPEPVWSALRFIVGGLVFQDGIEGKPPSEKVDVERVFAAVKFLSDRHRSEGAAFVSAWHPMVEELEARARAQQMEVELDRFSETLRERLDEAGSWKADDSPPWHNRIELGGVARAVEERWRSTALFSEAMDAMLATLSNLAWLKSAGQTAYLAPLANWAASNSGVIATLNYDNSVEIAAAAAGHQVTTGLDEWTSSGDFRAPPDGGLLLKLHGSMNWVSWADGRWEEVASPEHSRSPRILFGRGSKLTADGPYLDLLWGFRRALNEANRVSIVGYSFRDDHVNELLIRWHQTESGLIRIANGGPVDADVQRFFRRERTKDMNWEDSEMTASEALPAWFGSSA